VRGFAANLSLLFREVPLLERFAAARAAGFGTVELQFPYAEPLRDLVAASREAGLGVALINAPVPPDAPYGLACLAERAAEFRDGLERAVEYATALGAGRINVLAGQGGDRATGDCRRRLVAALLEAVERVAPSGIEVLLEFLNPADVPGYAVPDLEAVEQVLDACGTRVGLQFDVYHVARAGLDPATALAAVLPRVRHVQFADTPGRHEPGTGVLEFEPIWELLRSAGYGGHVAAEYRPSRTTVETLGWLHDWQRFTAPR
jgi:hydroxypyruvate isomerase